MPDARVKNILLSYFITCYIFSKMKYGICLSLYHQTAQIHRIIRTLVPLEV